MTPPKIQPAPVKAPEAKAASSNTLKNSDAPKTEKGFAEELAEIDNAEDSEGMEVVAEVEGQVAEAKGEMVAKALNPNTDMKATPVSAEDLINSLEQVPVSSEPTPKVLDPKIIKQVNEAVAPQGAEQVEVAPTNLQLKDLLMQQPQQPQQLKVANTGRSPAIDFAKTEVDPQLLNFEDFVAQKNSVTGKAVAPNAYGMPSKATVNAEQLLGEKAVTALSKNPESLLNADAQQLTAPAMALGAVGANELASPEVSGTPKTFNMQSLNAKNLDADSVMTQISDYIVQAKAAKEPTVQMRVNHQDLGMLDITVSRSANDMVSIVLGTQDNGAKLFLGQNRESLMSHLSNAGVNVSDLKMEQSSNSKNGTADQNSQQGGQQSGSGERQFGSEQNRRRDEQQRRQDLWELTREKEVA